MKRSIGLGILVMLLAACPGDKKRREPPPQLVQDTMPLNLDSLQSAIPPAVTDSYTPPPKRRARERIPPAPPALLAAVQREQSFSKFCYQEFGQKADPSLQGGVVMVVTVDDSGISAARVSNDSWSSDAGREVNNCLNEKAASAWKRASAPVKAGKYVVQLSFRPA